MLMQVFDTKTSFRSC